MSALWLGLGVVLGGLLWAGWSGLSSKRARAVDRRLLATLMHDLRTPLTSLQLTMGELAHHEGYDDDERVTLARAIEEVVALRSLLENLRLVEATASAPTPVERTEVLLHEQVERLVYRYDLMAKARKARLEIGAEPLAVQADPRLVELLLGNLVELALRSGATVVRVSLTLPEERFRLSCEVTDGVLPEPLTVQTFMARRDADRSQTGRSLAVVAVGVICGASGWSFTRPSPTEFVVEGRLD
ncbi:MAG: HAMP domain-containing histidine kinase [Archangiaceae bacterium]|nr:HAMP domain-containing histidine kinase [Archangiaceae bacterium]